ncbi:PPE domain-containing protein [Mycolicibacter virginiensis]|nr:PPE domain-containing protein [Mycolicibacter virginiensis]ULP47267.1 PPE domain-containing protein [Mycolicibacter virginiensis]
MNFAALPPEVNSGLMYAGAGSGPTRAAATAWKTMAAELESAANNYRTIIAELTDQTWQGPSATAMAAAATPYAAWMSTTATKASHAGTQAAAAATAYETAYAMTVPPAVIAANRTQLATLIATNFLGTNTTAIATTEAHYSEMWAQDATAMHTYATNAAAATQLPTFTAPQPNTAAGTGTVSTGLLFDIVSAVFEVGSVGPFGAIGLGGAFGGLAMTLGELALPEGAELGALGLIGETTPALGGFVPTASLAGTGTAWASVGKAIPVGAMSVPRAWAAAVPSALRDVTGVSAPSGSASATAGPMATAAKLPYSQMALAGAAGGALTHPAGNERRSPPATQRVFTAPPKRAAAPEDPDASVKVDKADKSKAIGVVAELRALVELRDSGILTPEKFAQRKQRLLGE